MRARCPFCDRYTIVYAHYGGSCWNCAKKAHRAARRPPKQKQPRQPVHRACLGCGLGIPLQWFCGECVQPLLGG